MIIKAPLQRFLRTFYTLDKMQEILNYKNCNIHSHLGGEQMKIAVVVSCQCRQQAFTCLFILPSCVLYFFFQILSIKFPVCHSQWHLYILTKWTYALEMLLEFCLHSIFFLFRFTFQWLLNTRWYNHISQEVVISWTGKELTVYLNNQILKFIL